MRGGRPTLRSNERALANRARLFFWASLMCWTLGPVGSSAQSSVVSLREPAAYAEFLATSLASQPRLVAELARTAKARTTVVVLTTSDSAVPALRACLKAAVGDLGPALETLNGSIGRPAFEMASVDDHDIVFVVGPATAEGVPELAPALQARLAAVARTRLAEPNESIEFRWGTRWTRYDRSTAAYRIGLETLVHARGDTGLAEDVDASACRFDYVDRMVELLTESMLNRMQSDWEGYDAFRRLHLNDQGALALFRASVFCWLIRGDTVGIEGCAPSVAAHLK